MLKCFGQKSLWNKVTNHKAVSIGGFPETFRTCLGFPNHKVTSTFTTFHPLQEKTLVERNNEINPERFKGTRLI